MKKLGKDVDSRDHWAEKADSYVRELSDAYHVHRLAVIDHLIPPDLYVPGKRIFDFGCGDAVHFPKFLRAGAAISGIDISPEMIALGRQRLSSEGFEPNLIKAASVDALHDAPDESLDAILSFNVLAYLSDEEDHIFYQEASRALKKGGCLVVTHSNELFDLFSLNQYTVEFYRRHFGLSPTQLDKLRALLQIEQKEFSPTYNIRENPLTYRDKLAGYGFSEVRQEFINFHPAPPSLFERSSYPSTVDIPASDRWKLMFCCSTFGSCARRL